MANAAAEKIELLGVTAPHFCAGLELRGGIVRRTAPILSYMLGWPETRVQSYCQLKGWAVVRIVNSVEM